MAAFMQVKNGYINGDLNDPLIYGASENIRAFIRGSIQNYDTKTNPFLYLELLKAGKALTGPDFRDFLVANYHNGLGPCANISLTILNYLKGDVSARAVVSSIRIEEGNVDYYNRHQNWHKRMVSNMSKKETVPIFDQVQNFDHYRLLRAIGIENWARLLMVLLGESVNV